MPSMRIGFVCPYSFDTPGGVQVHVLDLAEKFISQGHHVEVLGPASESTQLPDFVTRGGASLPIPYNGSVARLSFGPSTFIRARDFINRGQFDVLHIHEPNSPSFSMAALKVARGPIVATYHASSNRSLALKFALPFLRGQLEKIRGGIAVSEMARRWQVEMLGGDPILIPNGVETSQFELDKKPLWSGRIPEIVFLGRLDEPRKGLDILLRAVDRLDHDVRVTVIGGGTHPPAPRVDFVGRVSDEEKAEILGRADIYVAPNRGGESFGIVLVEAMAAGCVVVASDLEAFSAVCDAQSPQPSGMLFRNGDADDLASTLKKIIENPKYGQQLVDSGTQRAKEFDWDNVAKEVMRVYETVRDGTTVTAT